MTKELEYNSYTDINSVDITSIMMVLPALTQYRNLPSNLKSGEYILLTFKNNKNVSNLRKIQILVGEGGFFWRFKSSGSYTNWKEIM